MPHVVVKMFPGPSEDKKRALADRITEALIESIGSANESVSVAIQEVPSTRWMADVYRPDIEPNMSKLYKRPGYKPF
ncbi:tautomerase family protein [Ralstonia pseudosolanacearum]|uniref:Putative tautomerase XF_1725 n=1 Tax=Ralstonia solanacearum TaxID=305 RepID=A0A0S4TW83_RALSL|nr:4-oxalocrotonate tautomerase [Ralstonia solanacearum]CUV14295.1 putative tautomerase XF_1725 [Ralstonia solanacearum]